MSEIRVPRASFTADVEARRVDAGPTGVCLVRVTDRYFAIGDRCSHAEVSLSEGDIDPDECWIECWKHGSAFSLADGEPQSLPATVPVPVYAVRVDGDDVVVTVP
jgi:3-phenylpropionate/trans-cinnamate dioxygenase ferredoxin subunit